MSTNVGAIAAPRSDVLRREDFEKALQERDFGTIFRLLRKYQGITQAQIAAATGLTQGRISKLMSDRQMRVMHIDVIERIVDGLQIPGAQVGLAARDWETEPEQHSAGGSAKELKPQGSRPTDDWSGDELASALDIEPDAMTMALDCGNISIERLDYLDRSADRLGVHAVRVVPSSILRTTVSHFRSVRRLVHEHQRTAHRVRLVRTGAKLAIVVGELLFNLDSFEQAASWYRTAYHAAMDIGDRYLADIALAGHSYLSTYSDDPKGVLAITGSRLDGRSSPSPALAWLWSFNAKAHAALGAAEPAARAFDQARETLQNSARSQIRPGIFSFLEEKLAFYQATALVTLGDATRAIETADQALLAYDPHEINEPNLVRLERASALALAGDLDEACRIATAVVTDPQTCQSVTVRLRGRKFDTLLGARRSACVDDWRTVLHEVWATPLPAASLLLTHSLPTQSPGPTAAGNRDDAVQPGTRTGLEASPC